ncbi:virulence factor BrkB family protein [Aliiglaciecola lipolytica]|uniref:virulence factor BrkB family protein n=1 Tax=Aliiglaciecola lipolytica TaxID=477689 RepID=UPI001C09DA0D|nr:virulence factor BrkB family protein [Aliiglaciecola lipolytica]MBU2878873.1 virulence factor BrkB family protein [Aliiglaciecola lipolytica]
MTQQNWFAQSKRFLGHVYIVLRNVVHHCQKDNISVSAGHLAYVSLLSLVPFIVVFFSILSAFPAFSEVRQHLEQFVFNNFIPTSGDVLQKHMTEFVNNASKMGALSIAFLVVVALTLISNVDKTLNRIWQAKSERPRIYTFAIYWMVLTLAPLLIGVSVLVSSYLVGLANYADEYTPGFSTVLLKVVPFITSVIAFFILYMVVPNKQISYKHALSGAILAAGLFELSKKMFSMYVENFPSYQVIYGAIAVVPILFVWVYLSWILVLVGAEFTRALERIMPEEDTGEERNLIPDDDGDEENHVKLDDLPEEPHK